MNQAMNIARICDLGRSGIGKSNLAEQFGLPPRPSSTRS
jgi:hypothetical protein